MPALVRMRRTVGPAQVDTLPFLQQFGQMGVVGSGVGGTRQLDHRSCFSIGDCVVGRAASVAVGQCGCAIFAIGRQESPGMAFTYPHTSAAWTMGSWCSITVLST